MLGGRFPKYNFLSVLEETNSFAAFIWASFWTCYGSSETFPERFDDEELEDLSLLFLLLSLSFLYYFFFLKDLIKCTFFYLCSLIDHMISSIFCFFSKMQIFSFSFFRCDRWEDCLFHRLVSSAIPQLIEHLFIFPFPFLYPTGSYSFLSIVTFLFTFACLLIFIYPFRPICPDPSLFTFLFLYPFLYLFIYPFPYPYPCPYLHLYPSYPLIFPCTYLAYHHIDHSPCTIDPYPFSFCCFCFCFYLSAFSSSSYPYLYDPYSSFSCGSHHYPSLINIKLYNNTTITWYP